MLHMMQVLAINPDLAFPLKKLFQSNSCETFATHATLGIFENIINKHYQHAPVFAHEAIATHVALEAHEELITFNMLHMMQVLLELHLFLFSKSNIVRDPLLSQKAL